MSFSTDITLPAHLEPVFPDSCVVCQQNTRDRGKIMADTNSFWSSFFIPLVALFGWKRIEFPLCRGCRTRFYRQRWVRSAVCWAVLIVVVFVAMPYFQGWNRLVTKLAVLAIAIAALAPQILFMVFFPPWFDVTASKKTTAYEFKSEDYAEEFFLLNRDAYPSAEIRVDGERV